MIYVDTSVALARLLAENRQPPAGFWGGRLVASRLLEYETWTRVHALGVGRRAAAKIAELLDDITLVPLEPEYLRRALEPFPVSLRALDAIHLATAHHLRELGEDVTIAVYDERFRTAAEAMGFAIAEV